MNHSQYGKKAVSKIEFINLYVRIDISHTVYKNLSILEYKKYRIRVIQLVAILVLVRTHRINVETLTLFTL